ncbi:MAG: ATP-binding protein [Caulobacteraceae bacterium]
MQIWFRYHARRLTFQGKIRAATLVTAIAAVVVALLFLTALEWRADHAQLVRQQQALAEVLAANVSAALVFDDRSAAEETLHTAWRVDDVRSVALFDLKGDLFMQVAKSGRTAKSRSWLDGGLDRGRVVSRTAVFVKGARVGELVMTATMNGLYTHLVAFITSALAACVVALGLAFLISRWLTRLITRPLEGLSSAIADVRQSGDFTRRVASSGADEFGQLTNDFNLLLSELGNSEANRQILLADLRSALDSAEAANIAKSQFLANMSHEIRTPLNGVLGMTQALAMGELNASQRERVGIIRECGQSLLAVLNDILDLSKIEAGKFELEISDFDLGEVAHAVRAAFTDISNRAGLSFGLAIEDGVEGVWRGDSVRLRQILYNLVSNAVKFTEEGEVRLTISRGDAGEVLFSVFDTGMGMTDDQLSRLFAKFYQTDSSNTRRFGGTGLGLAICRELSELMGGSISARSTPGEGSTFTLMLPLEYLGPSIPQSRDLPATALGHPQWEDASPGSQLRVLAAEDNPANQLVLRALLQAFDITPTIVSNGRMAVDAWEIEEFDLILMDIQMPEMDGVRATKLIRGAEVASGRLRTPIIALSANAMTHQVREYLAAGMDGHVAKPIEIAKLQEMLEDVFDGAGMAPEAAA